MKNYGFEIHNVKLKDYDNGIFDLKKVSTRSLIDPHREPPVAIFHVYKFQVDVGAQNSNLYPRKQNTTNNSQFSIINSFEQRFELQSSFSQTENNCNPNYKS